MRGDFSLVGWVIEKQAILTYDEPMVIRIKTTNLDLTPSLETYIRQKVKVLERILSRFDTHDSLELHLEVGRTTKHHHKGPVFRAEFMLHVPKKVLRAVEESVDVRSAIDIARDELEMQIEKYKTRTVERTRAPRQGK